MARRSSIYVEGFSHENPIPAACRVGDLLFTGAVHGGGRGSHAEEFPADFGEQCRRMFDRVEAVLTAAGGTLDDVAKFSVRLADPATRTELNELWCALFPDPASRPSRQVTIGTTQPHIQVQCEVVAVLDTVNGSPT